MKYFDPHGESLVPKKTIALTLKTHCLVFAAETQKRNMAGTLHSVTVMTL